MKTLYCLFIVAIIPILALEEFEPPKLTCPTAHNKAEKGDFAKTVLMPGDPLRAKYVAEKYLKNIKLVNNVRGVQGYTGEYNGKRVSVMASGMGIPSIGIYSYELFNAYGVESIIRIGSTGSVNKDVHVRDIVVGIGASTNSNYAKNFNLDGTISAVASFDLLKKIHDASKKLGLEDKVHYGQLLSTDFFYSEDPDYDMKWAKMGILGAEMESYGLYLNAARAGKKAVAICTVSDDLIRQEFTDPQERERGFNDMMRIALEIAEE